MSPGWRRLLAGVAAALVLPLAAAQAGPPLTVATWNLRLDTPDDGPDAWPHRREAVRALIQRHRIDLLGTQEGLIGQLRDLDRLPGYARVGVGRDDGREAGEHAAILYRTERLALQAHGDFWLSPTPDRPSKGWDARCCHRLATWARLRDRLGGREFVVLNAHFDHEGAVARRESAALMLERAQALAAGLPVIVMGDFNAEPGSEPIALFNSRLRDAQAISERPPVGPVGTFNAFRADREATRRLDYVFVGRGWRALEHLVVVEPQGGRLPSDHHPVITRLLLETP